MPTTSKKSDRQGKNSGLHRDARDLHKAVSELVRVYQFRDRTAICYYDISVAQCYALSAIIKGGPMTLNELAAQLYLDKSTASRVVASLVRKGYVNRSDDPKDARALSLKPTKKGLELESKILSDLVEEMEKLISEYDRDTRRATARLIARLAGAASERFGQDRGSS